MAWKIYRVILRLRSPMHIGWGKVGNLQRTRPYVTGRAIWGALTMRLTRDAANGGSPAADSAEYQKTGAEVHRSLAFSYFYPATRSDSDYDIAWPWEDPPRFAWRFLGSYSGAAVSYSQRSSEPGLLHEIEFISPRTVDHGQPVFLVGYILEDNAAVNHLKWQQALQRFQIGGERGYGWGDTEIVEIEPIPDQRLFGSVSVLTDGSRPVLCLDGTDSSPARLLGHVDAGGVRAEGEIEPLVGREWRSNEKRHRHAGQHVEFVAMTFQPGGLVRESAKFEIGRFGVWKATAG